ncbi:MAG TPA: hypothetical protein DCP63_11490, partial [Bacteroidetes bacterium]|nr:hypothetical protein [Bacteroidota bacterium]
EHEAYVVMLWTAVAVPFVLVTGVLRATQMAYQRFDLVNLFQGALGLVQWLGAVICVSVGLGLVEIVAVSVAGRVLAAIGSLVTVARMIPGGWR